MRFLRSERARPAAFAQGFLSSPGRAGSRGSATGNRLWARACLSSARGPLPFFAAAFAPTAAITCRVIFFLPILLTACGGRALNKNAAQELIASHSHGVLDKKDVYVESVTQMGDSAVVETRLETALRLEKVRGKWEIKEVRVGRDQWENLDDFLRALNNLKTAETKELLQRVAEAIKSYQEKNGRLPAFTDFVSLTNVLNPDYLTPLVRLDAWRRPLYVEQTGPDTIKLMSAGPDGRLGTSDDIVLTRTF